MSELQTEHPLEPELASRDIYFAALERVAHALTDLRCVVAGPNGIALDKGGALNPRRPECWILIETRSSQPPPKPGAHPSPRRRQRIARIFVRNAKSFIVDMHEVNKREFLMHTLGILTHELNFEFHPNDVHVAPLFEAFLDDPPPSR